MANWTIERFKSLKDARARQTQLNEMGIAARLYRSHRSYALEYQEDVVKEVERNYNE